MAHYKRLLDIAYELDTGMICYVHRQTGELISFPDPAQFLNTSDWQAKVDFVATDPNSYVAITPMSNRASFQVMEDFADFVPSDSLRNQLRYALGHPKPFGSNRSSTTRSSTGKVGSRFGMRDWWIG